MMKHADVGERERRKGLEMIGGIAAESDAVGNARIVERIDRLFREPVISRDRVRNQRLYARVPNVLQLFPIGSVHVGLMSVEACRPPANLPDGGQQRIIGDEARALLKRKRGERRSQAKKPQRLIVRFNVELKISPGSPNQRSESPVLRPIRNVLVVNSDAFL